MERTTRCKYKERISSGYGLTSCRIPKHPPIRTSELVLDIYNDEKFTCAVIIVVNLHIGVGDCLHLSALKMLFYVERFAVPEIAGYENSVENDESVHYSFNITQLFRQMTCSFSSLIK